MKVSNKITITKPSITDLEVKYATDAAKNGWGSKCYEYIDKFEKAFKKHLNVKYAIATSSCTGALHMGLHALGIGPGDEVIMANTNWVATAAPIIHLGATPIYVDILEDTWCIDPKEIEKAITKKTKAIIAVHLYGNLCDMDEINLIGRKYNIPVIEDAAEAIGSVYKGAKAGSIGLFGTFSFHGSKTITTGEGGMFVTNNNDLYDKVLTLSNHGRKKGEKRQFWPEFTGFKYKMSNLSASIGLAQVERIDELVNFKRKTFYRYKSNLSHFPLRINPEKESCESGFWMPTIIFNKDININSQKIIDFMQNSNIDARAFFWPLSSTSIPGRKAFNKKYLSETIHMRALNLPSSFEINNIEIDYICNQIKRILSDFS